MTQRCFVTNCNSERETSGNPIAYFNVPTNDELRKKWAHAIPKTGVPLYRTDLVCEEHFAESDIIRYHIVEDSAGNVVQKVAYDYPRLAETAVPSIFPGFELRLNPPKVEISPERTAVQSASDITYNHILPPTAPPELDVNPEVTGHPPVWNVSEGKNPPLGWIIPEVTKVSPDSKVNRPASAGNYVPVSQPLMGQETSYNVRNPMNVNIQDGENQGKYNSYGENKQNDRVIMHEPIPVTFHPPTIAPVAKRRDTNDDDCCDNFACCCMCCLLIIQCLECCLATAK